MFRAVSCNFRRGSAAIGDNALGGWYGYRASKAAVNQILRCAAIEARRTRPNSCLIALHPGTVDTELTRGFAKTGLEIQPPALAAERILQVIAGLSPEMSGSFLDHHGKPIPW